MTVTIPAAMNGTPGVANQVTAGSKVFSCQSSDGPCQVQVGNRQAQSCFGGLVLGDPQGPALPALTFLNFGTVAVNVTFDLGNTAVKAATPTGALENFFNLPTFGNAGSLTGTRSLPTGNGAAISGTQTINGQVKTRQYIEISNFDGANILYVFTDHQTASTLDQCIGAVFPNSFRRFETAKNLVLVNIAAGAIQCTAYEIY